MEDLFIIKIGGETIDTEDSLTNCIKAIAKSGKKIILIHGGGKKVTQLAGKLGIEQQMVNGRRITNAETMELCTMVYAGLINKTIVAKLASEGKNSVGLSGADFKCIISEKRKNTEIDYGFVGDIKFINNTIFNNFIDENIIPVICAVSLSEEFQLLNTNADTMAMEIAKAMTKNYNVHLIYCFGKNGVLRDVENNDSVVEILGKKEMDEMERLGQIADGMLPKLQTASRALLGGVKEVKIINSDALNHYFENKKTGTTIVL